MKKKILALCLVIALAVTAVTGVTLAYFTDTDSETNVFTSGKVDITLNDEFVPNSKLLPGEPVSKVVSVTVEEDSEESWVWVEYLIPAEIDVALDVTLVSKKWTVTVDGTETVEDVVYNKYLAKYADKVAAGATTEVLFDEATLLAGVDYDNATGKYTYGDAQFEIDGTLNIIVRAFAIQAAGLADVDAAYTAYNAQ